MQDRSGAFGHPEKLWSKDFVIAMLTNFSFSIVFYLLMTAMAQYAIIRFHVSDAMSGFAASAFVVGAVMARAFTGLAMKYLGRRRVLVGSLVLFLIFSGLYFVADNIAILLIVRIIHGLGFGLGSTVATAASQSFIPPLRRSEGTGWFGTSTTVAAAIGPMLSFQIMAMFGHNWLFATATFFSVIGLIIGLTLRIPPPPPATASVLLKRPSFWSTIISTAALPISSVMFLAGFMYSGVLTYLNGYTQEQGVNTLVASTFFIVYAVVLLISRFIVGPWHDRLGDNPMVYPLIICLALSMTVLGLWPSNIGVLVSAALLALGFGALMSVLQAISIKLVKPREIGVATATFYLMLDLGTGIGPIILGVLLSFVNFSTMYLTLAGVALIMVMYYWFMHGRKTRLVK